MPSWGEADVVTARSRAIAAADGLPGVEVQDAYGHTAFLVRGSKFAWLLVDHHGDGRLGLWVKADRVEQQALVGRDPDRFYVPPYLGVHGWVGVLVDPVSAPDWDLVDDLVERAWRSSAGVRAVKAFDAAQR